MKNKQKFSLKGFTRQAQASLRNFRIPFRSLRWRLALSYSLVTVAALLVVELILMALLMVFFLSNIDLTPETLIANLRKEWTPMVEQFFSKEPPDIAGLRNYLEDIQGSTIGTRPIFILGNLELEMKARDFLNFYYLLDDRTLVDAIPHDIVPEEDLGRKMPYDYLPGLAKPLRAALTGEEDQNLLYAKVEPGLRLLANSRCGLLSNVQQPAAPPRIASTTFCGSAPAFCASISSSPIATIWAATII